MSKPQQILTLTSDPRNVSRVEPFVERVFVDYQINPDKYSNILISLTEAVTNAIIHGNHRDKRKVVRVKLNKIRDRVAFLITDEGEGFDFDNLPDPTTPDNILKIGGRGVFLMRQLSDEVSFRDNGRTVEIQFNL